MAANNQLQKYLFSALPFFTTWPGGKTNNKLSEEELLELYRYATLGKIAAGFFHELSNPLTAVCLNLETMRRKTSRPILLQTIKQTERMERFLLSARAQLQGNHAPTYFDVRQEIEESFILLAGKAKSKQVKMIILGEQSARLYGNAVNFCHIVTNLVSNAIDSYDQLAKSTEQKVEVKIWPQVSTLTITVQDFGSGISANQIPLIFKPFYTTKGPKNGLGVGLALTKESIENDFGGTISVKSRPAKGTTFTVALPFSSTEPNENGGATKDP